MLYYFVTSDVYVLDTSSRVSRVIISLVRQRNKSNREHEVVVRNSVNSVVKRSGVVIDLRLLDVIVDDGCVVAPVGHCYIQVRWTDYLWWQDIYNGAIIYSMICRVDSQIELLLLSGGK